jgi:hypothetical protein
MKTHASKTNQSQQLVNALFVVSIILFAFITAFVSNYTKSDFWFNSLKHQTSNYEFIKGNNPSHNKFVIPVNSTSNDNSSEKISLELMTPLNGYCLSNELEQNLKVAKLIALNKKRSQLILNNQNTLINDSKNLASNSESNALMEKINEYLIPEDEPELEIVFLLTPDKMVQKSKIVKNEYLENLRKIKMDELEQFYARQQKFREYLIVEKELPLKMEDWMIDENCWCFENKATLAANVKLEKY